MKKLLFLIIVFATTIACTEAQESAKKDNAQKHSIAVTFRLFPTENMWTFIKLNTRNGLMWQVQYDVNGENRFESFLNVLSIAENKNEFDDRFTLYPTQNMWTFILLDQFDGRMWQVQWSTEPENRGIIPIN
jgi:hypothetical protein